jgi:hypothetical protein
MNVVLNPELDGGLRDDTDTLTAPRPTLHSVRD